MFQIIINKKVNKFIDTLPNSEKVKDKLRKLKDFKSGKRLGLDIERFRGKNKNKFRIRIGEMRYIFEIVPPKIYIDAADYRGKAYS